MPRKIDVYINAKGGNKAARAFRQVGVAIGTYFGARAIKQYVSGLIEWGDQIGKSAKRIGITAEEFQKLSFAARRSGATTETVERAFKRMSSTIYDTGLGLKTAEDALKAVGLTFAEINNRSPEQQFAMIAKNLNNIEDATTRAAVAQDIFGRAGTDILPMLNDYANLSAELENMGGIMTDKAVAAAEDFKDSMENLDITIKSIVANSGLVEWLSDVASAFSDVAKNADKWRHLMGAVIETLGLADDTFVLPQRFNESAKEQVRKERQKKHAAKFDPLALATPVTLTAKDAAGQSAAFRLFDKLEGIAKAVLPKNTFETVHAGGISRLSQDPEQAFVTRFLSGMSGLTNAPMKATERNTQITARNTAETNGLLAKIEQKLDIGGGGSSDIPTLAFP